MKKSILILVVLSALIIGGCSPATAKQTLAINNEDAASFKTAALELWPLKDHAVESIGKAKEYILNERADGDSLVITITSDKALDELKGNFSDIISKKVIDNKYQLEFYGKAERTDEFYCSIFDEGEQRTVQFVFNNGVTLPDNIVKLINSHWPEGFISLPDDMNDETLYSKSVVLNQQYAYFMRRWTPKDVEGTLQKLVATLSGYSGYEFDDYSGSYKCIKDKVPVKAAGESDSGQIILEYFVDPPKQIFE